MKKVSMNLLGLMMSMGLSWANPSDHKNTDGGLSDQFKKQIERETDDLMKQKQTSNLTSQEIEKLRSQTKLNIVLNHVQRYIDNNLTIPAYILDEQKKLEAEGEKTVRVDS